MTWKESSLTLEIASEPGACVVSTSHCDTRHSTASLWSRG